MTGARHIPTPVPDPESAPFWEAAAEGRLLLRRCTQCGKVHWYPRSTCPFCLAQGTEWIDSPGRGHIYSCTVMRRSGAPYVVAYVELDEGPRVLTNIETDDIEAVRIGQRVEAMFVPSSESPVQQIPVFRPLP